MLGIQYPATEIGEQKTMVSQQLQRRKLFSLMTIVVALLLVTSCTSIKRVFHKEGTLISVRLKDDKRPDQETRERIAAIITSRMDAIGIEGEAFARHKELSKDSDILIDIFEKEVSEKQKSFLLQRSVFEIREVVSEKHPAPPGHATKESAVNRSGDDGDVFEDTSAGVKLYLVLKKKPFLTSDHVRYASAVRNEDGSGYSITFSLRNKGADVMENFTKSNKDRYMSIVYNDKVINTAFIRSTIRDSGIINGSLDEEEAKDISLAMNSGYFPYTLKITEEASYGKE